MRAVATITLYVYGDSEQELKQNAEKYAEKLRSLEDNRASLEKLHLNEFGNLKSTEIKI